MERICGFIVVRKPEHAESELLKPKMRVGEKVYRGVDRLRWEDFELSYYDRHLPAELLPIWQMLERDTSDFSEFKLLKDYQKSKRVLEFSGENSEIVAIWSPHLEEVKGASHSEVNLTYLGLDCVCFGEWSVVQAGVYERPEYFPEAVTQLNEHGLLTSDAECDAVFARYLELASSEIVEPLMEEAKATNIKVFGAN
jgi:hypothetical protein